MRIGFISSGEVNDFRGEEEADLLLFGFDGMGEVSYEKELTGESTYFERLATLSKREQALVVCGCVTDTRGHKRKSAAVAERGKLLGVSDMLHVTDGNYGSGAELRVYETTLGKMGVIVAEDLYFPETAKSLTDCGCRFLVCSFGFWGSGVQSTLLRAYAFIYGVPIFFCGRGYGALATPRGELAFASPLSPAYIEYTIKKGEYHLVESRRRGYFPTA